MRAASVCTLLLRLALGISFLSAVADRLGWWGAYGLPNVAWGNFARFIAYTGRLNPWASPSVVTLLARTATLAEAAVGMALLIGIFTRGAALLGGLLLLIFALAMTFVLGLEAPLSFSVYTASAASFLLACSRDFPLSVDAWRHRAKTQRD